MPLACSQNIFSSQHEGSRMVVYPLFNSQTTTQKVAPTPPLGLTESVGKREEEQS